MKVNLIYRSVPETEKNNKNQKFEIESRCSSEETVTAMSPWSQSWGEETLSAELCVSNYYISFCL